MCGNAFYVTTALLRVSNQPVLKHVQPRPRFLEIVISFSRKRIAAFGENPGMYLDKVWGEQDVGGNSVLYVSNVDLSFLSNEEGLGTSPLPSTTARAMDAVPFVFPAVLALMGGVTWIIGRRMHKHEDEKDE